MATDIGPKIGIDGEKEFRASIQNINQQLKTYKSEMKAATSATDENGNSQADLTKQAKILTKQIEAQNQKVQALEKGLEASAAKYGENDTRTLKWAQAVNEANAELGDMRSELKNLGDASDEADTGMSNFGVTVGTLAANAITAAISKIGELVSSLINLDERTEEFRVAQGKLNTAFEASGHDADQAAQVYGDFFTILGDADTAAESSQLLAKLVDNEEDFSKWTKIATGVAGTFGDALPINSLIEAANETAKTGEVTGVLADALNWAGISETEFGDSLASMGSEAERSAYIMNTLSGQYDEAADSFEKNNAAVINAREQQYALSQSSAVLGEAISGVKTNITAEFIPAISAAATALAGLISGDLDPAEAMNQLSGALSDIVGRVVKMIPKFFEAGTQLIQSLLEGMASSDNSQLVTIITQMISSLTESLPSLVTALMGVLTNMFNSLAEQLPTLLPMVTKLVLDLIQGLIDSLPELLSALTNVILSLIEGLVQSLPVLIEALPDLIIGLIDGILTFIPELIAGLIRVIEGVIAELPTIIEAIIEAVPQIIEGIITALVDNLPSIIEGLINLVMMIVQHLPDIILGIIEAIPDLIGGIIEAILDNIPAIIECGIELFVSLIKNLPKIIVEIVKRLPELIWGIVKGIGDLIWMLVEAGVNLVKGLWEGIKKAAKWLWDKVSGWLSDLWGGIKSFFGINSPSKEMAWIGEMLSEGLAKGIDDSASVALDAAESMADGVIDSVSGLSADVAVGTSLVPGASNLAGAVSGIVSGMAATAGAGSNGPYIIQVVLDSAVIAQSIFDPLGDVAKQRGVSYA